MNFTGIRVSILALAVALAPIASSAFAAESESGLIDIYVQSQRQALLEQGYTRWDLDHTPCSDCEIAIVGSKVELLTNETEAFMRTLAGKKAEIMALYQLKDGNDYNMLARMAVGILGRESKFFTSTRYQIKEAAPWLIGLMKTTRERLDDLKEHKDPFGPVDTSPNSRGPTQIKVVPKRIADTYAITPETLHVPENAALATIGFLIESSAELKWRIAKNHLDFINRDNYVDYLAYLYFGSTMTLINGKADPNHHPYVQAMQEYMSWVEIYERPKAAVIAAPEPTPPPQEAPVPGDAPTLELISSPTEAETLAPLD